MCNEGVIKFDYHCGGINADISDNLFNRINTARQTLFNLELIGVYNNGLSYGNVSIKKPFDNNFIISASDTGKIPSLHKAHYVTITSCNWQNNTCNYKGTYLPSSETLSHYIIYESCKQINAVIHIHHFALWARLKGIYPTTNENVEYGSVAMVKEIINLFDTTDLSNKKVLVMGGHKEGIMIFDSSIEEALSVVNELFKKYILNKP